MSRGYRIFGYGGHGTPAHQLEAPAGSEPSEETLYIKGAHKINEDGEFISAGGVWFGPEDERNSSLRVPEEMASKDAGEAAAILYVIQNTPLEVSLNITICSTRIIRCLTTDLESSESKGWVGIADSKILRAIVAALRGKGCRCTLREASGPDETNMSEAKCLAQLGLEDDNPTPLITDIPLGYDLDGMSIAGASQKTFYQALKAQRNKPERMKTKVMLDITRHAANELAGKTPSDSQIWRSIRDQDISRTTRDWMWKCLHQAYKLGNYWQNIPTYEQLATCQACRVDESMEHILLECTASGQETIWKLAKQLWEMKGLQWPEITYGSIFACSLGDFKDAKGKRDEGANRLFRILISESAHQIWKLRCNRVFERGNDPEHYHTEAEVHNKWLHCINYRLKMDILLTDSRKFGSRALNIKKVVKTWNGVLKDPENLPDIWVWQSGLLVGIPPLRPPGRNR
ncbi:ribonuclease H-like protein [Mycena crocata]|nr:ribonuclease H-like protein [Mycena crocata]